MSNYKESIHENKLWYEKLPHPMALIFWILLFTYLLTLLVPSGVFQREEVNGRESVVPGTFEMVEAPLLSPLDVFFSIPQGMVSSASIIFIVFIAGGLFRLLSATKALENTVGTLIKKLGTERQTLTVWAMTFIFGMLGMVVGYEGNIALIPLAIFVGLALRGDLIVGLSMAVGGIGFGFAASPVNPYTVGVSQTIADIPLFSGFGLRTVMALVMLSIVAHHTSSYLKKIQASPQSSFAKGLSTQGMRLEKTLEEYCMGRVDFIVIFTFLIGLALILYGVFSLGWYINEISGVFLAIAVICGLLTGMKTNEMVEHLIKGAASVTGGALIIGVARAIQVLLEQGQIGDTIINALAVPVAQLPLMLSSIVMTLVHGAINIFIPSGSGQAMATMPIMIPLSDIIGMTRQTAILAFQIGDGFTNMISPTSGGTLAMLALAGVPYDKWLRYALPLIVKCFIASWLFIIFAVFIGWGASL